LPEPSPANLSADLISFLQAIPEGRMRRGVRFPQWFLLLVAVLWILSGCQSLRDLERLAIRHHAALIQALGLELRRPPTESTVRYLFLQADVAEICRQLQDWMLAQIPDGAAGLDQLVCDGKTLRGSSVATKVGGGAFIAQVTLYSKALGAAIAQATYDTRENHERAVLRELLSTMDLAGVLIQADALHTQKLFFGSSRSRGPTSS
jgi:hypothetical protein